MTEAEKRKSATNKRKSVISFPKTGKRGPSFRKKSLSPKMSELKEDSFRRWDEIKEDMENDNYVYGLHDEIVERALEELRKKRSEEETVERFVESFCGAWSKLVRWRWMSKDDKGKDIVRGYEEPVVCPKDPWSSRSYGRDEEVKPRTALPAPLRCCPHPPLVEAEERPVVKPAKERAVRIEAAAGGGLGSTARPGERSDQARQSKIKTGSTEPMSIPHMPPIPKTAFPERADAKIFMGPQMAEKKKGNTAKTYTSEIDLTESRHEQINGNTECQQYSRLDL